MRKEKSILIFVIVSMMFLINIYGGFGSVSISDPNTYLNISYSPSSIEQGFIPTFYARYWDNTGNLIANANCTIKFNITPAGGPIVMLAQSPYYYYSPSSFSQGSYNYTVNCSKFNTTYGNLTISEIFTVSASTAPSLTITSPVNNGNYTNRNINLNFSTSDISNLDKCWYTINSGSPNFTTCNVNKTIDFGNDGLYSLIFYANDTLGNTNSSTILNITLDTTPPIIPIVWNFSRSVNTSTINIVGYVNESNANISVVSYNQAKSISFGINSSLSLGVGNLIGGFDVLSTNNIGDTTIRLNDSTNIVAGRFIEISGKTPNNFVRYNITSVDTITNIITIQSGLMSNITAGEKALIYSTQKYDGWFNLSVILSSDTDNLIEVKAKDKYGNMQNIANSFSVFYQTNAPRFDLSKIGNVTGQNITTFNFNILDNVTVNLSSLIINITNASGNSTYYMDSSYTGNLINKKNVTCINQSTNNLSCSIDINFTIGYYNITFSILNLVSLSNVTTITNYLVDLTNPLAPVNVTLGAFSTNTNYLNISWSNSSTALSGIQYYEYSVGTNIGLNDTYGWNKTNLTNVYVGPLSLHSNNNYYVNVRAVSYANRTSNYSYEKIAFIDGTGPIISYVIQPSIFSNNNRSLNVSWSAYDNESDITGFEIVVSKNEHYPLQNSTNEIRRYQVGNINSTIIDFSSDNLIDNITYYVTIYGISIAGFSNPPGYSTIGTKIDLTPPENISISYPTGRIASNNLTITIDPGFDYNSGIKKYIIEKAENDYSNGICSGTNSYSYYYEENISNSNSPNPNPDSINKSFTLLDGKCYSFRLYVENNAGGRSEAVNSISSSALDQNASIDSTPPTAFNVYDTIGSIGRSGIYTLNDDYLTAVWDKSADIESGIIGYDIWITEKAWGSIETEFTSPKRIVLSDYIESVNIPGKWEYNITNINLNLSNESDTTHQYEYKIYVKAINGNNKTTTSNTDGIIYIDNVPPNPTILWVENESQNTTPYYDYVKNNFTTVKILGEKYMSCQWSPLDQGYIESSNSVTNCTSTGVNGNQAICYINETTSGTYYYHISCKDKNGNSNRAINNLDLTITLDFEAPTINLTSPNKNIYSDNIISINYTVQDFSNITSWFIINSTILNSTFPQTPISINNKVNTYQYNLGLTNTYSNYTLTVYANDTQGRINSTTTWFVYDNSTPSLNINLPNTIYNESFNATFTGSYVRNITWDVSLTNNLSILKLNGTLNNSNTSSYQSFSLNQLINFSTLDDGNYTISVWYVNDINRSGSVTKTFIKDTTAPIIHLPIFYMNDSNVKDIVLLMNQTQSILGHNVSISSISATKDVKLNVDNISIYLNENNLSFHLKVGESIILSSGKKVTLRNVGSNNNTAIEVDGVITTVSTMTTINGIKIRIDNTYPSDDINNRSADITIRNYDSTILDDNTIVKLLPSYYIYNGLNYYDSKIILRIYNSSNYNYSYSFDDNLLRFDNLIYNSSSNYNPNTKLFYYDALSNRLFINQNSNISLYFGIEDLININSTSYIIYDQGNPLSIRFSNNAKFIRYVNNQSSYYINENLSSLQLTESRNFTIKITAKDDLNNQNINYYNFTVLKNINPSIINLNVSNNYKKNSDSNISFINSSFFFNFTCNNSNKAVVQVFNYSNNILVYENIIQGQDIINSFTNINFTFVENNKYVLTLICSDEIYNYNYTVPYTFIYDNSSPIVKLIKPVVSDNYEYFIQNNGIFNNVNVTVQNITNGSAEFKINLHTFQTINDGENVSFYSGDYQIKLLSTYVDKINPKYNFASFRLTTKPNTEKIYPSITTDFEINVSGDYLFKRKSTNLYFIIDDNEINQGILPVLDVTIINEAEQIINRLTTSKLNNLSYNTNINGSFFNITINFNHTNFVPGKTYSLKINSTDIFNRTSIEIFNFSIYNEKPNFTYYGLPSTIQLLNKEDNIQLLNAYDLENDRLNYTIDLLSDKINATLIGFENKTYMKLSSSNESYNGSAWIVINVTDTYGGFNRYNFTINISDSIGPLLININSTELNYLKIINNVSLPYATDIRGYELLNQTSIRIALPKNININVNIDFVPRINYYAIITKQINFSEIKELNVSYKTFNTSNINKTLFLGNTYNILDAFIFKIDNTTFNKSYYVYMYYKNFNISIYNATNFLKIYKLDINTTDNINYNSILMGNNISINSTTKIGNTTISTATDYIWAEFNNFSLFVLAIEKPTNETCGDGIDQDHNGSDLVCSIVTPPSTSGGSSGSGSSTARASSGGGGGIPRETCIDNIKNQDETNIDCGGKCGGYFYEGSCHTTAQATCFDNIKNQGEEGIDCGGLCTKTCIVETPKNLETCNDNKKNQDETNIDCGGTCGGYFYSNSCHRTPQQSCFDNILNQNEEGIDCGGVCFTKCKNNTNFSIIIFGIVGLIILGASVAGFVLSKKKSSNFDYNSPSNTNVNPNINTGELFTINNEKIDLDSIDFKKILNYVNEEQSKGTPNSKIKILLLNANWPEKMIEAAFERTECSVKLKELSNYIKKARANGHSEDTIRYHLIKAEWAEHFIDMVVHEVHEIHDDFKKVEKYAKTMLEKGYSKDDVLKTLVDIGWNKEDVYPYIVGTDDLS